MTGKKHTIKYQTKRDDTPEYYGVFIKKKGKEIVSLQIDPERLYEIHLIDKSTLSAIKKANQGRQLFTPLKKSTDFFAFEKCRERLNWCRRMWIQELKPAINCLQTPQQAADQAYLSSISDGILDPEECSVVRLVATISRGPQYQLAIKLCYAQFILLLGSMIEGITFQIISQHGFQGNRYSRKALDEYVATKKAGLVLSQLPHYSWFDKIYTLWAFLKHNSKKSFDCLKRKYSDFIIDGTSTFQNGQFAFSYLRIDDAVIDDLFEGLRSFFDEFCSNVIGEDLSFPRWNTELFFLELVKEKIEDVQNPLGLSKYV